MKRVSQIAAVVLTALSIAVLAFAQTSHSMGNQQSMTAAKGCPAMETANDSASAQAKPAGCCQMAQSGGADCCQAQEGQGGCCQSMGHSAYSADLQKFNADLDKLVADMNKASKDKKLEAMTAVINKLVEERRAALGSTHTMPMGADSKADAMCCAHCPMMSGGATKTAPAPKKGA
jgi:ElaB/YqjD/DUF883 family membrane-anchored ribosome-binding protein